MAQLFANNARTTLAVAALVGDTNLTVVDGSKLPTPTGGDYFYFTLASGAPESAWEVVKVTARATNMLTVVRAQDGTTAQPWAIGTKAELRLPAQALRDILALFILRAGDTGIGNLSMAALTATSGTFSAAFDVTSVNYGAASLLANSTALANFRGAGHVQLAISAEVGNGNPVALQVKHASTDGGIYPLHLNPLGGLVSVGTGGLAVDGAVSMGALTATTFNGFAVNPYSANGSSWGGFLPTVGGSGVMEIGKYIDFHEFSNDGVDYSVRLYSQAGTLTTAAPVSMGALTATMVNPGTYTVATLPVGTNGAEVWVSNARKAGEGAGSGTGVAARYTNSAWRDPVQAYSAVVA